MHKVTKQDTSRREEIPRKCNKHTLIILHMKIIQNIHKYFRSHIIYIIIYKNLYIFFASRRNKLKVVLAINRALLIMIFHDSLLRVQNLLKSI